MRSAGKPTAGATISCDQLAARRRRPHRRAGRAGHRGSRLGSPAVAHDTLKDHFTFPNAAQNGPSDPAQASLGPLARRRKAPIRLGETGVAEGSAPRAAVLHVDDLAVAQRQHLKQRANTATVVVSAPPELHHHSTTARLDHRRGQRPHLLPAMLEDRPGLVRAASTRRPTPPQPAAGNAPPLQSRREERDERVEIAIDRGPERNLDHIRVVGHVRHPPTAWMLRLQLESLGARRPASCRDVCGTRAKAMNRSSPSGRTAPRRTANTGL